MAFIASDKRYTVEKLLGDMGSLLSEGVFDELPELARYDLQEGGRALAFELPTAAAFHFLRATEAVLRDFYLTVVRSGRIKEPRMLAAMVKDMRGKRRAPAELVLNNLDSLRHNFRIHSASREGLRDGRGTGHARAGNRLRESHD